MLQRAAFSVLLDFRLRMCFRIFRKAIMQFVRPSGVNGKSSFLSVTVHFS